MELLKLFVIFLLPLNIFGANDPLISSTFFHKFEKCQINSKRLYLDKKERALISERTGIRKVPFIVKSFEINCGESLSKVFLLNDLIRTHHQAAFFRIEENKLKEIEVVRFEEPIQYKAPFKYIQSYLNKNKFDDIDGFTGATLTSQSLKRLSTLALEFYKLNNDK